MGRSLLLITLTLTLNLFNGAQAQESDKEAVFAAPGRPYKGEELKKLLKEDFEKSLLMDVHGVSALGSTTVPEKMRFNSYDKAVAFGRRLADHSIPVRTGGGPGIMEAAALGNRSRGIEIYSEKLKGWTKNPKELDKIVHLVRRNMGLQTQGVTIFVPAEVPNSSMEKLTKVPLMDFSFRKEALLNQIYGIRGSAMFPGRLGTLEEDFQVWSQVVEGEQDIPLVAVGEDYYKGLFEVVRKVSVEDRKLISPEDFDRVKVFEDGALAADCLVSQLTSPLSIQKSNLVSLAKEMETSIDSLKNVPWTVTVLGGRNLSDGDPTLPMARMLAQELTSQKLPLKVGNKGALTKSLIEGVKQVNPEGNVEGFFKGHVDKKGGPNLSGLHENLYLYSQAAHNEAIIDKSLAYVIFPGDLDTLMKAFTILDWIKLNKLPKRPVILVGKDYWEPIFNQWEKSLQNGLGMPLHESLKPTAITDDGGEILKIIRANLPPKIEN